MINNFNMSSSGVNIEVNIFWDHDTANWNFNDNFKILNDGKFLYLSDGNLVVDVDNLAQIKKLQYPYEILKTRSQEDHMSVILLTDELERMWGIPIDSEVIKTIQKEIDNMAWSSPLRCQVSVNGQECYVDKYDGYYGDFYDLEDIKKYIIDDIVSQVPDDVNKDVLRKELGSMIPNHPEEL